MVNVKTAAAMIGKSQTFIIQRANMLKLRDDSKWNMHWNFTMEDIEKINQSLPRKTRKSNIVLAAKHSRLSKHIVRKLASDLKLKFRTDYDKILQACELKKTGFYTIKGIKHILGL